MELADDMIKSLVRLDTSLLYEKAQGDPGVCDRIVWSRI